MRAVAEFTLRKGAKRSRGTLVVLGYLSGKGRKVNANILKIAAAYEVLHAYLLVHDDIIDRDVIRRGRPTLHKLFEAYAPSSVRGQEREALGQDIAIIAGDIASDLVQRLILDTGFSEHQKLDALAYIEQTLHTTYIGQILDILALPERVPGLQEQYRRYLLKTAIYTIEAPFMLGVKLGRGKVRESTFRAFARHAGLAFQLADDVENAFGKSLAARSSDIKQGKVTLLISLALQSSRTRKQLVSLLKKKRKGSKDLQRLRLLIKTSGGYGRAVRIISQGYKRAGKLLESVGLPNEILEYMQTLLHLQQKLVEKDK